MIPRRCHVKRIYGKRVSDDAEETTAWIDVLRIDVFTDVLNAGGQRRDVYLKWQDNPETPGQDTASNPRRTMETVRITTDANDGIYFEVKAIKRMATINSDQRQVRSFRNAKSNTRRTVNRTRVYHVDVDLPPSASWSTYVELLAAAQGSRDTSQYVDTELVASYVSHQQQGFDYQAATQILKRNTALKDLLATAPDSELVARLDPFQMIVNCQLNLFKVIQITAFRTGGPDEDGHYHAFPSGTPISFAAWKGGFANAATSIPGAAGSGYGCSTYYDYVTLSFSSQSHPEQYSGLPDDILKDSSEIQVPSDGSGATSFGGSTVYTGGNFIAVNATFSGSTGTYSNPQIGDDYQLGQVVNIEFRGDPFLDETTVRPDNPLGGAGSGTTTYANAEGPYGVATAGETFDSWYLPGHPYFSKTIDPSDITWTDPTNGRVYRGIASKFIGYGSGPFNYEQTSANILILLYPEDLPPIT